MSHDNKSTSDIKKYRFSGQTRRKKATLRSPPSERRHCYFFTTIGLSVIWLLVIGTQAEENSFRPVTALWIIAVPLMDMSAVMHRRVKKGKSLLAADRNYLHRIFMKFGFSSRPALLITGSIFSAFALIGLLGEWANIPEIPEGIMMVSIIVTFIVYDYFFIHIWRFIR